MLEFYNIVNLVYAGIVGNVDPVGYLATKSLQSCLD